MPRYHALSASELSRIMREQREYEVKLLLMDVARTFFGESFDRVEVFLGNHYNDEYYVDEVDSFVVFDSEDNMLTPRLPTADEVQPYNFWTANAIRSGRFTDESDADYVLHDCLTQLDVSDLGLAEDVEEHWILRPGEEESWKPREVYWIEED